MFPIKIAISENHFFTRRGLIATLKNQTDFKITFETDEDQSLLNYIKNHEVDIVFISLQYPIVDNIVTIKKIKNKCPNTKIILLSYKFYSNVIMDLISAGVSGFLLYSCNNVVFTDSIYKVNKKEKYFDPGIMELLISDFNTNIKKDSQNKITNRQIEIIKLLYEEKNSDEIANILFLSKKTVEWHKTKIFEKVGCKNSIGAIKFAINNGIIKI